MKSPKMLIAMLSTPFLFCTPDLQSQVRGSTLSIIPQFGFREHKMSYILTNKVKLSNGLFAAAPADFINVKGNSIGIYAAYTPHMKEYLTVSFRIGYTRYFTSTSLQTQFVGSDINRTVDYAFNEFSIEPLAVLKVWKNLSIIGGARFGFVNREYFSIKSEIVSGDYRFDNDAKSEVRESDGLPNNMLQNNSLSIGITYDFELIEGYYISPEIIATIHSSEFFSGFTTVPVPIRTGLSLKYVIDE